MRSSAINNLKKKKKKEETNRRNILVNPYTNTRTDFEFIGKKLSQK